MFLRKMLPGIRFEYKQRKFDALLSNISHLLHLATAVSLR
jgi:hypothetical protein